MVARLTGGVRLGRLMLWPPAPIIILYVRRVELASFLFCELENCAVESLREREYCGGAQRLLARAV